MRRLLMLLGFLVATVVNAQVPRPVSTCAPQVPWGAPVTSHPSPKIICRNAYLTANDTSARLPIWTAYTLTPEHAVGCVTRSDSFVADNSLLPGTRAELTDYRGSGYDRGHLAPDADMSWRPDVEQESFILTNIVPQNASFNRGIWARLESNVRAWALTRGHNMTVYTGPIYNNKDKTIGMSRVVVPRSMYKIVIDDATREVAGWLFTNDDNNFPNLDMARVSVARIEQLAGVRFMYPAGYKELAANAAWPADQTRYATVKRNKCN